MKVNVSSDSEMFEGNHFQISFNYYSLKLQPVPDFAWLGGILK